MKRLVRALRLCVAVFILDGLLQAVAVAAPVPVGDPTIYATIRHLARSGPTAYIEPNPAVELIGPGVVTSETDLGAEIALALATNFGLYGAEAAWIGSGRVGGQEIRGTDVELFYEQRFRTTTSRDSLSANLFGMFVEGLDASGFAVREFTRAAFYVDMWVTPFDPPGPDAVNNPTTSIFDARYGYARFGTEVRRGGSDPFWTLLGPSCLECRVSTNVFPVLERDQSNILATIRVGDMTLDLGNLLLPVDTEFTLTTRVSLLAQGARGEAFAEARFYDPLQGHGLEIVPSEIIPIPEPQTYVLFGAGLAFMTIAGLGRRVRRGQTMFHWPKPRGVVERGTTNSNGRQYG